MSFRLYVAAVRQYWMTFTLVTVAVFGLGVAWIVVSRDQYVSTAQLLVSLQGSTTAEAYQNDDVVEGRVNSYIALMTTDVVSQRVIDKLGLHMTPSELSAEISAVNVPPKTAVIDVAVADESRDRARQLAQTVAEEFVSYVNAIETPTGEGAQKVQTTVVTAASEPHQRTLERILLGLPVAAVALMAGGAAVWVRSTTGRGRRSGRRSRGTAGAPVAARDYKRSTTITGAAG